jgi:hypothetical protein
MARAFQRVDQTAREEGTKTQRVWKGGETLAP